MILSCTKNESDKTVFKNVNIIPMTEDEKVLENYSIYISGGIIISIGKFDELKYPDKTKIIDSWGKYLVPGFSDMHVHIAYPEECNIFIANGVTLVRNMWGSEKLLEEREKIQKGKIPGPEIFTAGPAIDGRNSIWQNALIIDNIEDVTTAITGMKDAGYDAIKILDNLTPEVYDKIISVSNKMGIPVVGHVPLNVGIEHILSSGQKSIEHLSGYNIFGYEKDMENDIRMTVDNGIWNCPTLIILKNLSNLNQIKNADIPEIRYVHPERLNRWSERFSSSLNNIYRYQRLLKKLGDSGANIVSGTDTGTPYVITGFSLHQEFILMSEAGLKPYQILLSTTVNPARMLGILDKKGTIEEGKDADLVLLNKNPLLDIRNTQTIEGVMIKGAWLPKKALQHKLDVVEKKYKKLK